MPRCERGFGFVYKVPAEAGHMRAATRSPVEGDKGREWGPAGDEGAS
jgi:hypothetical protein